MSNYRLSVLTGFPEMLEKIIYKLQWHFESMLNGSLSLQHGASTSFR